MNHTRVWTQRLGADVDHLKHNGGHQRRCWLNLWIITAQGEICLRPGHLLVCVHACVPINRDYLTCKLPLPYLTAETLVLRTEHRISFGNMNRGGHSHRQTWFCGISHRWGRRFSGPEAAWSPPPSSWPGPCMTQTAGATSCKAKQEELMLGGQRQRCKWSDFIHWFYVWIGTTWSNNTHIFYGICSLS